MIPTSASQALTLADHAMQSKDPVQIKIAMSLLGDFSILDDLPLVTNPAITVKGRRITGDDLPDMKWGRINKAPELVKTTMRPYEEQAALVREMITVDRRLLKQADWIDDPVQTQIDGVMEAHRYDMTRAFFYNDPAGSNPGDNPDAWVGIKTRLANAGNYGLVPGLTIQAGDLDLRPISLTDDAAGKARAEGLISLFTQAFAALGTGDGKDVKVYTNWYLKARFEQALRLMNAGLSRDKDNYDREVDKYRQAVIRDAGWNKNQIRTMISDSLDVNGDEVVNGTGAYTELFFVRMGDKYMKGWQTEALKPERLGRSVETGVFENILIDWACGLAHPSNRPFVRITGLRIK